MFTVQYSIAGFNSFEITSLWCKKKLRTHHLAFSLMAFLIMLVNSIFDNELLVELYNATNIHVFLNMHHPNTADASLSKLMQFLSHAMIYLVTTLHFRWRPEGLN
jgi:hypothetical protein